MQAIGTSCAHSPGLTSFLPQEGYTGVTRASLFSASSRKSTDISLVTTEGDKVTISANSALQVGLSSYDYRGRLNGNDASLQGRALQVSSENSFAISVEGDLSKAELQDIQDLVGKIEKLGMEFFSHPLEDSLSQALSVGNDLDSIASFDAHLSFSQQLTPAREFKEETEAPSAPPSLDAASLQHISPSSTSSTAPALLSKDVQPFVNKLLQEAHNSQLDPEKVADKLPKFLTKLFHRFAKEFNFDGPKQHLADHIREKTVQGLKDKPEQSPVQATE
jgi:hypothetical protein